MNIFVGTTDACLKITLNDNCKINAYKLFYLDSLAYYIQDKNNDCADLIHNGYILYVIVVLILNIHLHSHFLIMIFFLFFVYFVVFLPFL
jgi:hypothetical protein